MIRPGDQVYVVHQGYSEYQTVLTVGRRWAETARLRFDKDTLLIDGRGYSSPGQVWLSLESWQADKAAKDNWQKLKELVERAWAPPAHLTAEKIQGIIDTLRGEK